MCGKLAIIFIKIKVVPCKFRVADPDPDPHGIRIFGIPGSGSAF